MPADSALHAQSVFSLSRLREGRGDQTRLELLASPFPHRPAPPAESLVDVI